MVVQDPGGSGMNGGARMTADAVLEAVRAGGGPSLRLLGRCTGGEVGAHVAETRRGDQVVFKWIEEPSFLPEITRVVERVGRLRRKGFPIPQYWAPLVFDGGVVLCQEMVRGSWSDEFDNTLVDRVLALNDLQGGEGDARASWTGYMAGTLTTGADGYCLHEPLRTYSDATRALLSWIEQVGADLPALPAHDLVHLDFHHRNMLQTGGELSAVIDWEGCRPGDRAFDLVTFCFGFTHALAPAGLDLVVWQQALRLAHLDRLATYVAHVALRRLDWTIRHHTHADVERVLELAHRYRSYLG
jgi:tRNA A-37 threonylcarbamoyl transferase component Bud32